MLCHHRCLLFSVQACTCCRTCVPSPTAHCIVPSVFTRCNAWFILFILLFTQPWALPVPLRADPELWAALARTAATLHHAGHHDMLHTLHAACDARMVAQCLSRHPPSLAGVAQSASAATGMPYPPLVEQFGETLLANGRHAYDIKHGTQDLHRARVALAAGGEWRGGSACAKAVLSGLPRNATLPSAIACQLTSVMSDSDVRTEMPIPCDPGATTPSLSTAGGSWPEERLPAWASWLGPKRCEWLPELMCIESQVMQAGMDANASPVRWGIWGSSATSMDTGAAGCAMKPIRVQVKNARQGHKFLDALMHEGSALLREGDSDAASSSGNSAHDSDAIHPNAARTGALTTTARSLAHAPPAVAAVVAAGGDVLGDVNTTLRVQGPPSQSWLAQRRIAAAASFSVPLALVNEGGQSAHTDAGANQAVRVVALQRVGADVYAQSASPVNDAVPPDSDGTEDGLALHRAHVQSAREVVGGNRLGP